VPESSSFGVFSGGHSDHTSGADVSSESLLCPAEWLSSLETSSGGPGPDGVSRLQLSPGFCLLLSKSSVMTLSLSKTSFSSASG
jgi:hypothetical protein